MAQLQITLRLRKRRTYPIWMAVAWVMVFIGCPLNLVAKLLVRRGMTVVVER